MNNKKIFPLRQSANPLFGDIKALIEQSRQQVAVAVNSAMSMLYWQIGKRINEEILHNKRAGYGKQIVPTLSALLEKDYGKNFTEKNLRRMMQFAEEFADLEIVVTLSRQLSWSHFLTLTPLNGRN